jgi:hypothetical protein
MSFARNIGKTLKRGVTFIYPQHMKDIFLILQDMELRNVKNDIARITPEDISLRGYKVFSQNEEDGIIQEIFSRIGEGKTFVEIGTGDGRECNTINLLFNGWKGVWFEGSSKDVETIRQALGSTSFSNFQVNQTFIDLDNIQSLMANATAFIGGGIDFFSLDIDGNDYYILKAILGNNVLPKVICVEYNAKFPPPMKVVTRYKADQVWAENDYMGASLMSWVDLLEPAGYSLLCCTVTGVNAFFVKNEYMSHFHKYPVKDLYRQSKYYISKRIVGHPASLQNLKAFLH